MKTTVVGSYPIPAWLAAQPSAPARRDAILVVLKTQELAGIELVTDGEIARFDVDHPETNGMIDSFVAPLSGVTTRLTRRQRQAFAERSDMSFRTAPAGVVEGEVGEGTLDLAASWTEVRDLASAPLKFTLTSPYMLARTLLDEHYGDLRALCNAIAGVLAEQVRGIDAAVVQVDEASLTGHPEDGAWAHEPINTVLDAVPGECAVHLCFGNYGGSTIQQGHWRGLVAFLNRLHADHLVLEMARRDPDELVALRELRPEIGLGVGVIDIKDTEVETAEQVARRIEWAAGALGAERIRYVHPDCGFWMLARSIADRKMRALVAGRDLFAGGRVTGE